jgi:hypothetical protein
MARLLSDFVADFVLPLLHGGSLGVGAPIRTRDRDAMFSEGAPLFEPRLRYARLRRAQLLTANPSLPDPDLDELSLWVGLHNALVFDHPDRRRVWARASTWRRVEGVTRTFLSLPSPRTVPDALVRHLSVGAFLALRRVDTIVASPTTGEVRFAGQQPQGGRARFLSTGGLPQREEVVEWLGRAHAPEADRLIEDAMRASPLTCLLAPRQAPSGWSPLESEAFLRDRAYARSICHHWAKASDWVQVGGAVTAALLRSLPRKPEVDEATEAPQDGERLALPGVVLPTDPAAVAAVVGALVHLHFLKVLELEARLGVAAGSRDPGVQAFLAMPLLLPLLQSVLGSPLGGSRDGGDEQDARAASRLEGQIARRWGEYLDHLDELVARSVLENLLAAVVPRVVQPS